MMAAILWLQALQALDFSRGNGAAMAAFSAPHNHCRKPPLFPGAAPVDPSDIQTCINQTGQTGPTNALLGKPAKCQCRHGYPQAFSLDPAPPPQQFPRSSLDRLNSGLLRLTCPLLVSAVDVVEDDGFIKDMNRMLVEEEGGEGYMMCFQEAHRVHADTRKALIFGEDMGAVDGNMQTLQSKLGERGANAFLNAGVAGANPSANSIDVKCLHAWLADYIFRKTSRQCHAGLTTKHPIGDAIVKELRRRGIDIAGTETCHEVCSGQHSSSKSASDESMPLQVPIPRNKQRRKRRQLNGISDNQ